MEKTRVELLLDGGFQIGKKLKKSLLITECVPGGTSTAFAVLSGLGINELINEIFENIRKL